MTTTKQSQIWLMLCTFIGLTACGGGGDGGGSPSGSNSSGAAQTLALSDLNVAYENALQSTYHLDVDVMLSQLSGIAAYISICDNSQAKGSIVQIDYNHCLIKAPLQDGTARFELSTANHYDSLIAVIWPLEENNSPITFLYQHSGERAGTWLIQ